MEGEEGISGKYGQSTWYTYMKMSLGNSLLLVMNIHQFKTKLASEVESYLQGNPTCIVLWFMGPDWPTTQKDITDSWHWAFYWLPSGV